MAKKPVKKPTKKAAPKKSPSKPMKKAAPAPMKAMAAGSTAPKARTASKPKNGRTLSYTQSEFVENIRAFCGFTKRAEAKNLCEDIALFIMDSLKRGYRVPLMGLGKLYVKESQARQGRNPATGEIIQIPKRKKVRFAVAKALKERVLR